MTLGPTSSSADELLRGELQATFADKPDFSNPASTTIRTIGGETWVGTQFTYQGDAQQDEYVAIFATVHQGKGYLIEMQAAASDEEQFHAGYDTYYVPMLNKFRFFP